MKKMPTLFKRDFEDHNVVNIRPELNGELEWVLDGLGLATLKLDGACAGYFDGKFYKRYDAKHGKTPPAGAIPVGEPDPVTGHWPHWLEVSGDKPEDKWFIEAYRNYVNILETDMEEGTYEAIGPHFQSNPYELDKDILVPHGSIVIPELSYKTLTFDEIKAYLENHYIEGIVFWKDGQPGCKIKRSDFGLDWNKR